MEKRLQNNKGFSLIEVLISIVVLSILFMAAMNAFATVAKINKKADMDQKAATLAQNVLESMETLSLEETLSQFHSPDFDIISSNLNEGDDGFYIMPADAYGEYMKNGTRYLPATAEYLGRPDRKVYYLALRGVKDNNAAFDVMVRLDTALYGDSKYVDTMNNFEMPNLLKLDANKVSIVNLKNDTDSIALSDFVTQYTSYLNSLPTPSVPPSTLSNDIKAATNKTITLDIIKSSASSLQVSCKLNYTTTAGSGAYQKSYTYNTDAFSGTTTIEPGSTKDGNVYLFYTPSMFGGRDVIKVINNGAKINFYLVNQMDTLGTNINITSSDTSSGASTFYTNYPGTLVNGVAIANRSLYEKQNSDERIYDISVSVYPKGTIDSQVLDHAYVTFQSAKEN